MLGMTRYVLLEAVSRAEVSKPEMGK
jgi:hypothetical protein